MLPSVSTAPVPAFGKSKLNTDVLTQQSELPLSGQLSSPLKAVQKTETRPVLGVARCRFLPDSTRRRTVFTITTHSIQNRILINQVYRRGTLLISTTGYFFWKIWFVYLFKNTPYDIYSSTETNKLTNCNIFVIYV